MRQIIKSSLRLKQVSEIKMSQLNTEHTYLEINEKNKVSVDLRTLDAVVNRNKNNGNKAQKPSPSVANNSTPKQSDPIVVYGDD